MGSELIETLSKDDDDGNENVGKKTDVFSNLIASI